MFAAVFMTAGIQPALVYRERAEACEVPSSVASNKGRSQGIGS